MPATRPRALLTLPDRPWPPNTGKRMRGYATVSELARLTELDVVVLSADSTPLETPPLPLRSYELLPLAARSRPRAVAGLARGLPIRLAAWNLARAVGKMEPWDLIWFGALDHYLLLKGQLPSCRTVIDLDDMESRKAQLQLQVARGSERLQRLIERPLWQRLERRTGAWADVTIVCSDVDRARLAQLRGDGTGISVVPNSYPTPPPSKRLGGTCGGPITMVGNFDYEPNADAAHFLAGQILPLAQARDPRVRFQLVGRHQSGSLEDLVGTPGLDVVGEVPDIAPYLQQSSLAVVPLRIGGGTRIKILEAMAWGVPVVSSRIGYEGLDVEDVVVTAESPQDFAVACTDLYDDEQARRALSRTARGRYLEYYTPLAAAEAIAVVIEALTGVNAG